MTKKLKKNQLNSFNICYDSAQKRLSTRLLSGNVKIIMYTIIEFIFFYIRTVHLDIIKFVFIHQLMH